MSAAIKLPLTDDEKSMLRQAKVKIADVHRLTKDEIAERLGVSNDRANVIKGLADFQSVPSIGHKLAEKLVFKLNIYSLEEMREKDGAQLIDELEQKLGVWTDSCVEDQIRCVIYFSKNPSSSKQWFDFTEERKRYRQINGYPENRPKKGWYE